MAASWDTSSSGHGARTAAGCAPSVSHSVTKVVVDTNAVVKGFRLERFADDFGAELVDLAVRAYVDGAADAPETNFALVPFEEGA